MTDAYTDEAHRFGRKDKAPVKRMPEKTTDAVEILHRRYGRVINVPTGFGVSYDAGAEALYISLGHKPPGPEGVDYQETAAGGKVILDFDWGGELLGIEVLL